MDPQEVKQIHNEIKKKWYSPAQDIGNSNNDIKIPIQQISIMSSYQSSNSSVNSISQESKFVN